MDPLMNHDSRVRVLMKFTQMDICCSYGHLVITGSKWDYTINGVSSVLISGKGP